MPHHSLPSATLLFGLVAVPAVAQQPIVFDRADTPVGGAPRAIVSADFNRDGFPDVAVGGTGRALVAILFNRGLAGSPRFASPREVVVGGGPFELAAADLNKDGLVDIAVANADANAVTILFNDAGHQFTTVAHVPVAQNPRGLAIADFNRDGHPDIIVTKYAGTSVDVLLGAGDGTFPTRRTHAAPMNAQGVAAADLNCDGWIDAAVVSVSGTVSLYTMNGTGVAARRDVRRPFGWNVVTTGDFNRDGTIDLAYASTAGNVVEVMYLARNGTTFTGDPYPVVTSPRGIEAADVNRDGALDLVVAGRTNGQVSVLLRNIAATTHVATYGRHDYAAGSGARDVVIADADRDGRLDLLTANEFGNSVTMLANVTDFGPVAFRFDPQPQPPSYFNQTFDAADFNANGTLDLLRASDVLLDGVTSRRLVSNAAADSGAAGDFNRDGRMDAVLGVSGTSVYLGDGSGGFSLASQLPTGFARSIRAADMNRDGVLDVVVASEPFTQPPGIELYLGRGDGTFTLSARREGTSGRLDVADVDRDGILDVAVATGQDILTLLGNGTGGWKASHSFAGAQPYFGVALGDVTSDGILDLAIAEGVRHQFGSTFGSVVVIARGRGDGTFEEIGRHDLSEPGVFPDGIFGVTLADINHDGQRDVFTSSGVLLPGTGTGGFGEPQRFAPWALMTVLAADVNHDGLVDLAGLNTNEGEWIAMLNTRTPPSANRPPAGLTLPDVIELPYGYYWVVEEEGELDAGRELKDPDLHDLRYRWSLADGTVLSRERLWLPAPPMISGTHRVTFTADDYRGGTISKTFTLMFLPRRENVLHPVEESILHGAWRIVEDETALFGRRVWHPNASAPKLTAPLANPTDYIDIGFLADPSQEYKLWIRLKADANHWGNDSVFVQFSGAKDGAGNPLYAVGSTSALAVNLEECSGCGISGWGWEDDGWGAVNRNGVTLRFPEGGRQMMRIQTREDGVSIDQIVLSSERYLTARPGTAKHDDTHLQTTGPWMGTGWFPQ